MSERKKINEEEFDIMLENSFSDALPKDVVKGVTPWKKGVNRVLIGLIMSTVMLNFFCLEYILSAVGTVLMLLGFRTLRNDNKYFKACFVLSALEAACCFQSLVLGSVLSDGKEAVTKVTFALTVLRAVIMISELFCFWRALVNVKATANLPKKATPALVLLICYVTVCIFAIINFNYPIAVAVLLAMYLVTIFSVYRLSKELDTAGYTVEPACVKVSDKWIVSTVCVLLAVGLTLGYVFGGGYEMKWESADMSTASDVQKIKNDLENLGFPNDVLADLTSQEIISLDGALEVVSKVCDKSMTYTELEKGTLTVTTVAVKVPYEIEKWTVIHHFAWRNGTKFFGTHSLQIWPAYQRSDDGWLSDGEMTGRVLYESDGKTFTAPYHCLEEKTYTAGGSLFSQVGTDTFAAFSLPKNSENCRGYVMYSILKDGDTDFFSSWLNYTYQKRTFQYPVKSAMQQRLESTDNKVGAFRTEQYSFLYNPNY